METSTFYVGDIKGEYDIKTLEQSLLRTQGIERVLMDTDDYKIKIEYDEKTIELQQIAELIHKPGYNIQ